MAALNFPDPNVQPSYTNPDTGITYEWSNGIWKAVRTAQTAPELFVDVDGDNLTGNLTLGTDKIVLDATIGSATFTNNVDIKRSTANSDLKLSGSDTHAVWLSNGNFALKYDGSATFAGGSTTIDASNGLKVNSSSGAFGQVNGDGIYQMQTDGSTVGAQILANGSATFANDVSALGYSASVGAGPNAYVFAGYNDEGSTALTSSIDRHGSATFQSYINAYDVVTVSQPVETYNCFAAQLNGSTNATIKADGSATFGGVLQGDQRIVINGAGGKTGSADTLLNYAGDGSTVTASFTADGSATFAAPVNVGSLDYTSNSGVGSEIRNDGLIRVQRASGSSSSVFQAWRGNLNTVSIEAGGNATFAGDVVTGVTNALVNTGSWMQSIGGIYTTRPAGSTDAAFACFQLGSGTPTATIGADGSAYFHKAVTANGVHVNELASLTNGGQLGYDDPTKSLRLYSNSSTGTNAKTQFHFNQSGTADITFNEGGSATFGTTTSLGSHLTVSGGQATNGAGVAEIRNTANSDGSPALVISKTKTTTSYLARFVQFYANNGSTAMGGIVGNGASNVQFSSLSDVREKENIQSLTGSLEKVKQLEVVEFDWKESGEHIKAGFTAQNVETVFPEYVIDNVANEGMESRKGITGGLSSGYIAVLTAALQEAVSKIETLEQRLSDAGIA